LACRALPACAARVGVSSYLRLTEERQRGGVRETDHDRFHKKGQVILPKAIREQLHWEPGACLTVEHTGNGVLLKAAPVFAATRPADVFGSLAFAGPPKTLDEMEEGIAVEAKRRHARRRCQPRRPFSNWRSYRAVGACEKLDRRRGRVCLHNRAAGTESVLRGVYPCRAAQAARALRALAGLARVTLEDPRLAARGLGWRERGMDFADALHLAKAVGCEAFVSFDRRLARAANKLGAVTVRAP
jgi:AbrB family looped-hinge helix DNA binding protein